MIFLELIRQNNFIGGQTSKKDVISSFEKGGFSSKYSFFEHVCEETLIELASNKQSKIFVLFLFF